MLGAKRVPLFSRILLSIGTIGLIFSLYSIVWASPVEQMMSSSANDVLLIALNEQSNSGQSGWAKLTDTGDDTTVWLFLSEGALSSNLVHIHSGQCGDSLGAPVHVLTSFSDGMSSSVLTGVSFDDLLTGDFAINAHSNDDPGVYTACGNIPAKLNSVTIVLGELSDSGQSGFATLTSRGDDTEVVASLSEGAMTSGLVHIHSGQCGVNLGAPAHILTSFSGGSSVTLLKDVSLTTLLNGSFAVNAHNSVSPGTYTACGNLPVRVFTAITPGTASSIASPDEVVAVTVSADAPSTAAVLLYESKTSEALPVAPSGVSFSNTLFDLTALGTDGSALASYSFTRSITISVKYTDADIQTAEGNPSRLVLYKFDTTLQSWIPLSTTLNVVARTVQAQVSRLSSFALMGQARPATPTPTAMATLQAGAPTLTPAITATAVAPTESPTVSPTAVPVVTIMSTALPPTPGDVAPGSGLLLTLLIAAGILIAAGGYYLRETKQA